jgi:hypothetical protein
MRIIIAFYFSDLMMVSSSTPTCSHIISLMIEFWNFFELTRDFLHIHIQEYVHKPLAHVDHSHVCWRTT